MESFLPLLCLAIMALTSGWRSDAYSSSCEDRPPNKFNVLEGEALYFKPKWKETNFTWYRNGLRIENITTEEEQRIHHHGPGLFFLNISMNDSGVYTARVMSGHGCFTENVRVSVFSAGTNLTYGSNDNRDINKNMLCPGPVKKTCSAFNGTYSWYQGSTVLEGQRGSNVWVYNATKQHVGIYTCICTWTHHGKVYNMSGSKALILKDPILIRNVEIVSPTSKEQLAVEGVGIKLNCTVFCGINAHRKCVAQWQIDNQWVRNMTGYNESFNLEVKSSSGETTNRSTLTIARVSAQDFHRVFKCVGDGFYTVKTFNITLVPRDSASSLMVAKVCVLLGCVVAVVLVKCFALDLALLLRPYFTPNRHKQDPREFDAFVISQTQGLDSATDHKLSCFINKVLPSVLEEKCGYRLFIQGRDDLPGEDHLEMVDRCMRQSKRLMVVLTPGLRLADQTTDGPLDHGSGARGFNWQVGLHHALLQREMNVILLQLGETGPQGYSHLPLGLQHLIHKSAPLRWHEGARGSVAWNSRFWKNVRYLMPVRPAKKTVHSIV